jgi:hypothetical protein
MASTGIQYLPAVTARAGSQITVTMHTNTFGGANTVSVTATNGTVACDVTVWGDPDGFLELPFADMDTMQGVLAPSDLLDAQILLTEADVGGVTALIAEQIFN